jgi:hypothetical protein
MSNKKLILAWIVFVAACAGAWLLLFRVLS